MNVTIFCSCGCGRTLRGRPTQALARSESLATFAITTFSKEKPKRSAAAVPSLPGKTKSKRDQSSFRLFWMGEPDRKMRCGVCSCLQTCSTTEKEERNESDMREQGRCESRFGRTLMYAMVFVVQPRRVHHESPCRREAGRQRSTWRLLATSF